MVTKWGLSDKVGPLKFGEDDSSPFLGRSASQSSKTYSDETSKLIDSEIKGIINSCYERAETILKDNMDKLHTMAEALLKYETIDQHQIDDIMSGAEPREPSDWNNDDEPPKKSTKESSIKGPAEEL